MSRGFQGLYTAVTLLALAGSAQAQDTVSLGGSVAPPPPPPPAGAGDSVYGAGGSVYEAPSYSSDGPTGSSMTAMRPANGPAVMAWAPVSPLPSSSGGVAVPRACVAMSSDGRVTAAERPQWTQLNCARYYP